MESNQLQLTGRPEGVRTLDVDGAADAFRDALTGVERDGVEGLLQWLESSDFFTAPASTRYHGAYAGGLVQHSVEVLDYLLMLDGAFGTGLDRDSMTLCALLHDVCKVGFYKVDMRWRKNSRNQWEQYPAYKIEEDFPFGGHGSKSVYLIQHFVALTPEEAAAINCHMGAYDSSTYSNPSHTFEAYPLAWLLHVADEASTYMGSGATANG